MPLSVDQNKAHATGTPQAAQGGSAPSGVAGLTWPTATAAVLLAAAGLFAFSHQFSALWNTWTTDALRSIGILIPPVSLWLALRAWSKEDWAKGGSWWGLPVVAITLLLGGLYSPKFWVASGVGEGGVKMVPFQVLPVGVLICLYWCGVVLLLGGWTTLRKAWFPLALWLFVNPVPVPFEVLLDQPLQILGAQTARGMAHLIGVPVTGDALKLMFSSDLGIFIAPGCDGLRGASTMGYMALVIGYLWKMPAGRWAAYVAGAIIIAYLFNLVRLCAVVGYYWVALRVPFLGNYGTEIDYLIGGTLFFCAAAFLFLIPRYSAQNSPA